MFNKYDLDKIRGLADVLKEIRSTFTSEQLAKIKEDSEKNWVKDYTKSSSLLPKKTIEDKVFEGIYGIKEDNEEEGKIIENNPLSHNYYQELAEIDLSKSDPNKLKKYKHTQKALIEIQKNLKKT